MKHQMTLTKLFIFTFFALLLLGSCASGNISSYTIKEPVRIYDKIAVVWTSSKNDITGLDSITYNETFRRNFNNLDGAKYRKQLEKTFTRNMFPTQVITAGELFDINRDYGYDEFIDKIEAWEAPAILVIKQASWQQKQHIDGLDGDISTRYEPDAKFHVYLIDAASKENIWMATSGVSGDFYAGYETINNNLARKVVRKLRKEGYIANKDLKRAMQ
ncbi:hypothetical protein [Sinomicrobium sp. M5D2P17]